MQSTLQNTFFYNIMIQFSRMIHFLFKKGHFNYNATATMYRSKLLKGFQRHCNNSMVTFNAISNIQ